MEWIIAILIICFILYLVKANTEHHNSTIKKLEDKIDRLYKIEEQRMAKEDKERDEKESKEKEKYEIEARERNFSNYEEALNKASVFEYIDSENELNNFGLNLNHMILF